MSLYDNLRLKNPKINKKEATWNEVHAKVKASLVEAKAKGGQVVVLTNTTASPSTDKLISDLATKYTNVKHIIYDAISDSNALDAFQAVYGFRGLANYNFADADTIVSVGADFLCDWQGGGYDAGYAKGRVPKNGKMSKHIQIEANMSLSGANADKRIPLTIANQKLALVKLYNAVTGSIVSVNSVLEIFPNNIDALISMVNIYLQKGDVNNTEIYINKALAIDANNKQLYYILGTSYIELKQNDKAAEALSKAIEIDPEYNEALYQLGAHYYNWAAETRSAAMNLDMKDPKVKEMEKRANELFTLALIPLEKYIEKNPNEKSILDILYKTNTKLGRIEKGQEYKKRLEALKQQ